MKILVDINHPAHVHFFKNFIWEMQKKGHEVIVTASRKDIAFYLLEKYSIKFIDLGSYGNTVIQKALNVPVMAFKMIHVVRKYNPEILLGIASSRIAHAAFLLRKKSFVFTDTEHAKEQIALFKPFATSIFTPDCFRNDLGKKQVRYPGYHELAYLHPNRFTPNPEVLKEIGLNENDKFFIVRFVSWEASHDIGQKGLNLENKIKLIEMLKPHGKIIITSERELPEEFEEHRMRKCPTKMHDLLYYADMYFGESPTMATESAILGTKSFLINSWAYNIGNMIDISEKYELMKVYRYEKEFFEKFETDLEHINNNYKLKHKKFLEDKIDVTDYFINLIENE